MRVEIDSESGFCFGVVGAISKAEECLAAGTSLISLGDIVHNGAEMARLEALGLEVVPEDADLAGLAGRTVLVRAHGEPPATYSRAREYGVTLIDATCPVVARLQKTVAAAHADMSRVGGRVVIFGRRGHAEVRGLAGQVGGCLNFATEGIYGSGREIFLRGEGGVGVPTATESGEKSAETKLESPRMANSKQPPNGDVTVVENEADLDALDFTRPIYFLAQTTSSLAEFRRLADGIRRRAVDPELVTANDTVCRQVSGREEHLAEFARRFDVVIFVSGAKSSNGRVLFEAVRAANPRSHKIEDEEELRAEWFKGASSVGICGATSTPRWSMMKIAEKIESWTR